MFTTSFIVRLHSSAPSAICKTCSRLRLRAEGVSAVRSLEFLSVEAMKQCALASMGIAVLPEVVVHRELKQGLLVALDWPSKPIVVYTQLYRHRDKWMSPVMAAFWSLAVATCAAKM